MPQVHTITKAKLSTKMRRCRTCGHEVQPGESYKYMDKRTSFHGTGVRFIYCGSHFPKPSELASGRTSEILSTQEGAVKSIDGAGSIQDLIDALTQCRDNAEAIKEGMEESVSNIEDGFGHSTIRSEEMQERADGMDEWMDTLDTAVNELESLDPDEDDEDDEDKDADADPNLEEANGIASDAVAECPG